jgi:transcriptional regulator with XRE-family HTH domain
MIIGDRLREMREEKKLSQGDIENALASCVLTFLAWKTVTPSQPYKRLRRWLAL